MSATIDTLKLFIEHAPPATPSAVAGWTSGEDCQFVCGACASRIMGRGCQMPRPLDPVWERDATPCCLCGN